jgi:hypothetical protein
MAQTGGPASSIVVASIGRQCLLATDAETTPTVLGLATIQGVEGKQDLADLAPKDRFTPPLTGTQRTFERRGRQPA